LKHKNMSQSETPISFERLIDWLEGRLSDTAAQETAARLDAADADTQADVAWLRQFYDITRNMVSAEPPAELTERLGRRFAAYAQGRRSSRWQRFVATLSFDSHRHVALGARSVETSEVQRQLIYRAEPAMAIVTVQRHIPTDRFDLLGQVIPTVTEELAEPIQVILWHEGEVYDSAIADDLGEFTLVAVPVGRYELALRSELYEITISPLDLYP
jgi:hypothetical protein